MTTVFICIKWVSTLKCLKKENNVPQPQYIAEVLTTLPFDKTFDYHASQGVSIGAVVRIPFGKKMTWGVITSLKDQSTMDPLKLKAMEEISWYHLPPEQLKFVNWMASYTMAPRGSVLKMLLCMPDALVPETKRQKVLDMPAPIDQSLKPTKYSPLQESVLESFNENISKGGFQPFLLDGVTGSGKTDVYFQAIADTVAAGKQCLILLPEIALTPQWLDRFERRFGTQPVIWNSRMTPAQKRHAWRWIVTGQTQVVVGARSALLLPYQNLGMIVIDEEHDLSYKQEEGVIYHARDMGVVKANLLQIPIILASATPCLESLYNAKQGKYHLLTMHERYGPATFPKVDTINLKDHKVGPKDGWISQPLIEQIEKRLNHGEQSLLYLNRRGYAPLTLCQGCGFRLKCPNCTSWLVQHRFHDRLMCHHCGYHKQLPHKCPGCQNENTWVPCGPGVERIAEEVCSKFPQARPLIMASDLLQSHEELDDSLNRILNHEVDIIIGTQMMAKGHHFPQLTLVGVLDADVGLSGGDLRACEKTYQLLHQVAGRCGRAERPGEVFIQTYDPEHAVMQALIGDDKEAFMAQELLMRQEAHMPPFGRLASVILSCTKSEQGEVLAKQLRQKAPLMEGIEIFGPAPAPLATVRRWHRWRFLLRAPKIGQLQTYLQHWLPSDMKLPHQVKIQIDIDPVSFL